MDSPAMFRRLAADGTQFPTRPGTPWPTATHTTVVTASGARYEFREHGARVYVTSRGSTAGSDLSNALLRGGFPLVTVGRPMLVFSGEQGVRITMPVTGWERTDVMTRFTSTSADEEPRRELVRPQFRT